MRLRYLPDTPKILYYSYFLKDKKGDKTMIKRFTATGLFEVVEKTESDWNAICAGRNANWLSSSFGATVGVQIILPDSKIWYQQASLVLVCCPEGRNMGLDYRHSYWVLWQAYDKDIDDNLLIQSICSHLAFAKFLEEGLCQPVASPPLRYPSIKR
uniref:Uncharacterized protein n=1 Tax=Arsenophonus endosymbiont of Trialeurodes vaporariorum TaxID=235567 RepID=A0A3B0LVE0_9GAMM